MHLTDLHAKYNHIKTLGLSLNMQRGQPSNADFDLSNDLLSAVSANDTVTPSGVEIRNYGGGIAGLAEARELFADLLEVSSEQVIVGNNASLELMSHVLSWALLRGLKDSTDPWVMGNPKIIVTTPGYDRHFSLLQGLGYELLTVGINSDGPDVGAVEALVKGDSDIKGMLFVPTYSNPTGDSVTVENAERLAALDSAAPDFTLFLDDAYRVHHLYPDDRDKPVNFVALCKAAGKPDRAYVFASTSKVTFGGGGLGYLASSEANIGYISKWLGLQSIGPNKLEQYRHVKFLDNYPGGIEGLMTAHAEIIRPKFEAVWQVLEEELADIGLASWTKPKGGYFISLDTTHPVADRVVELAKAAGVSLTPAGAAFPNKLDPNNSNIRLAPTRPDLAEVKQAMEVVTLCVKLASSEWLEANA